MTREDEIGGQGLGQLNKVLKHIDKDKGSALFAIEREKKDLKAALSYLKAEKKAHVHHGSSVDEHKKARQDKRRLSTIDENRKGVHVALRRSTHGGSRPCLNPFKEEDEDEGAPGTSGMSRASLSMSRQRIPHQNEHRLSLEDRLQNFMQSDFKRVSGSSPKDKSKGLKVPIIGDPLSAHTIGQTFEILESMKTQPPPESVRQGVSSSEVVDSPSTIPSQKERKPKPEIARKWQFAATECMNRMGTNKKDREALQGQSTDSASNSRRQSVGEKNKRSDSVCSSSDSVTSLGDPNVEEFMRNLQKKYGGRGTRKLKWSALQHYYRLINETDMSTLMQVDQHFDMNNETHKPLVSLRRIQRRKLLALEAMIQQLPRFKFSNEIEPVELLNCGYLRLTEKVIEQLEDESRNQGVDPGVHCHMTQKQVENYFRELNEKDPPAHRQIDSEKHE